MKLSKLSNSYIAILLIKSMLFRLTVGFLFCSFSGTNLVTVKTKFPIWNS